jgi:hypothetical protein
MKVICECPRTIEIPDPPYQFEMQCIYCNYYWIIRNGLIVEQGVKKNARNNS